MNTEFWNLLSVQNPDVTLYPVSYSQHCIALSNFNKTGNVSRELQSKTDGIIMARIFYSRQVGYDRKRQNSKGIHGQNKQKEEISYAQMELPQQEENSMIHVSYP
jgi:hypothetical protein